MAKPDISCSGCGGDFDDVDEFQDHDCDAEDDDPEGGGKAALIADGGTSTDASPEPAQAEFRPQLLQGIVITVTVYSLLKALWPLVIYFPPQSRLWLSVAAVTVGGYGLCLILTSEPVFSVYENLRSALGGGA